MRTGSCLCGAVRFEVSGDLPDIQACQCRSCRKASGTAFVAVLPIAKAALTEFGKQFSVEAKKN